MSRPCENSAARKSSRMDVLLIRTKSRSCFVSVLGFTDLEKILLAPSSNGAFSHGLREGGLSVCVRGPIMSRIMLQRISPVLALNDISLHTGTGRYRGIADIDQAAPIKLDL